VKAAGGGVVGPPAAAKGAAPTAGRPPQPRDGGRSIPAFFVPSPSPPSRGCGPPSSSSFLDKLAEALGYRTQAAAVAGLKAGWGG